MKKLTKQTKLQMLRRLIELLLFQGYDISFLIGKPLSYFNFEVIEKMIEEEEKKAENI